MSLKSWLFEKGIQGKLPDWLYRFLGKQIAKKMDLQEDSNMETKKWFQSKTVWTAIIAVVLGAVQPISKALGHEFTVPAFVFEILTGMGLYGLRTGDKPVA